MRKFIQNKLWRDKAPSLMEETGSIIHIKELSDEEYSRCLKNKLIEETNEVVEATEKADLMDEISDILEVIDAICKLHKITPDDLQKSKNKKFIHRGGFYERKFVTIAEHKPNSFGEDYCLKQPKKYPEIV